MSPSPATPGEEVAGWHVEHVAETGSTNDDLVDAARAGAPDRSARWADYQTGGHGRLDRRWDAPPGTNLLLSMLFRDLPADPHELTRIVGLAALDALLEVGGRAFGLKWPNDVLTADGERKVGGILATAGPSTAGRADFVVVGLGLNVNWHPDGAASLSSETGGRRHDVSALLVAVLRAVDRWWASTPDRRREAYLGRLTTLRREVRVELPGDEIVEGRAIDVDQDGRLVVLDRCGLSHHFAVGDVVHVRTTTLEA